MPTGSLTTILNDLQGIFYAYKGIDGAFSLSPGTIHSLPNSLLVGTLRDFFSLTRA
jgi:hypothetical protein